MVLLMAFIPMAVCLAALLENAFYHCLNFQFFSMLAVEKGGCRNHLPQAVTGACCPPPVLAVGQE